VPILLLGQNHRTAPVELRERLAFDETKVGQLAKYLKEDEVIHEAVVVSTCNRVEIYAVGENTRSGQARLAGLFEKVHGIPLTEFGDSLYQEEDAEAIRHLFRVASGLDSMVLGEGQILSQVKAGYALSRELGLTREVLHRAFHQAAACGKKVRTETRIGEGAVSVAFAAVELAKKIFQDLAKEKALLIGAGATGRKVAHHMKVFGVEDVLVTNRTAERGRALAENLGATWVPWENYGAYLSEVAIVVTAASVHSPLFTVETAQRALEGRGRRPLFLIDLGVPRDIDPQVGKKAGIFLYNVDDLENIVAESSRKRQGEAAKAEEIVDDQLCLFLEWLGSRSMTPTLKELRERLEIIRSQEIARARNRLDDEALAELERVSRRIVNKILHTPTVRMKDKAAKGEGASVIQHVRHLFGLDDKFVL
jgi:glutamyl-tRNA reductase